MPDPPARRGSPPGHTRRGPLRDREPRAAGVRGSPRPGSAPPARRGEDAAGVQHGVERRRGRDEGHEEGPPGVQDPDRTVRSEFQVADRRELVGAPEELHGGVGKHLDIVKGAVGPAGPGSVGGFAGDQGPQDGKERRAPDGLGAGSLRPPRFPARASSSHGREAEVAPRQRQPGNAWLSRRPRGWARRGCPGTRPRAGLPR